MKIPLSGDGGGGGGAGGMSGIISTQNVDITLTADTVLY